MAGRSWRGATAEGLERVRALLLRRGGAEDRDIAGPHEVWRVRIERTVFTAYSSGTVYCNGLPLPELGFLYESISEILGPARGVGGPASDAPRGASRRV